MIESIDPGTASVETGASSRTAADFVFTFSYETYSDAVRRGMMRPPDRILASLMRSSEVRRLLVANPFRWAPRVAATPFLDRDVRFPASTRMSLHRPTRMRRDDPTDVSGVAAEYARYDRSLRRARHADGARSALRAHDEPPRRRVRPDGLGDRRDLLRPRRLVELAGARGVLAGLPRGVPPHLVVRPGGRGRLRRDHRTDRPDRPGGRRAERRGAVGVARCAARVARVVRGDPGPARRLRRHARLPAGRARDHPPREALPRAPGRPARTAARPRLRRRTPSARERAPARERRARASSSRRCGTPSSASSPTAARRSPRR